MKRMCRFILVSLCFFALLTGMAVTSGCGGRDGSGGSGGVQGSGS